MPGKPWVKGQQSANPSGQSSEMLTAVRHLTRLVAGGLRNITVEDVQKFYRNKDGEIIKSWFLEFLKLAMHYLPTGVNPDANVSNRAVTIKVEVIASGASRPPASGADAPAATVVEGTLEVKE